MTGKVSGRGVSVGRNLAIKMSTLPERRGAVRRFALKLRKRALFLLISLGLGQLFNGYRRSTCPFSLGAYFERPAKKFQI